MRQRIIERRSPMPPTGREKGGWLSLLEQGASLFQEAKPLKDFMIYLSGFQCGKHEPGVQVETHHYCRVINQDLLQCILFDGNRRDANLIGIEYIVSERLFGELPEPERSYWHPHNYEVLSAELIAPGLPQVAETALMKQLVNSYGKTWYTWRTGRHDVPAEPPGQELPLGEPMLMWSFNRFGECDESLKEDRDQRLRVDAVTKREQRQSLLELVRPQHGVDAMKEEFLGAAPIPGVADSAEGRPA